MKPVGLCAIALALAAALWLARRDAEASQLPLAKVEPLLAAERRALEPREVELRAGDAGWRYERRQGGWWCVEPDPAPALGPRIEGFVAALEAARGLVRAREGEAAEDAFGLGEGSARRIAWGGRAGGRREVALGAAQAGPGRVFARAGTAVLEVPLAADRLAELDVLPEPPWLDRRLLAGCGFDPRAGIQHAFVDLADGRGLELRPGPAARGPQGWEVVVAGTVSPALPYRLVGWLTFLARAPYVRPLEESERASAGLEAPLARVTLLPSRGEPFEIAIGRAVRGGIAAVVSGVDRPWVIDASFPALVAPSPGMLRDPDRPNPWEAWMRRR